MKWENVKKYYGFAKKSGTVVVGTDKITASGNLHLILICSDISENAKARLARKATKTNCFVQEFGAEDFRKFEPNENIKAVAIKSEELAKAMQK